MNDYRITYISETGESSNAYVTERTESAARKSFAYAHKGMGLTIQSVELHRENTSATKPQEREALAAIEKMVEELGPQSYVATAFEGCFEDAENNIENDFGDSMKSRWEFAEKQLAAAQEEIKNLKGRASLLQETVDSLRRENKVLEQQALSDDNLTDISWLLSDKIFGLDTEAKNAAQRIVETADQPGDAQFQNAVKDHRTAQAGLSHYTALLERVNAIKNAD